MTPCKLWFSFLLFLGLVSSLPAADAPPPAATADTPTPLVRPWPQDKSDLKPDSAAVFGTLPNGFRYIILPNKEPPGRVSLRLRVNAGSLMEDDSQQGIAHFLEHMAFNGSKHHSAGEMVEYLQRLGLGFGADTNAHTGFNATTYMLELPEVSDKYLRDGLQILRDDCDGLLLPQGEIPRERNVVLSEMRDRDGVDYRTFVADWQFLFPDGLPPKRMPIGKEADIRAADHTTFENFWTKWYTPDRVTLIVVGDVKPDEIIPYIKEYFGPIAVKPVQPDPDMGKYNSPGFSATLHREPEAPAVTMELDCVAPFTLGADRTARRENELTLAAANFILTRRLERITRQADAPISQSSAYSFDQFDAFQVSEIDTTCQPGQWQSALDVVEQQLRSALEYGFTDAEVNEARALLLNNYEQAAKNAPTRKSRDLANEIEMDLNGNRVFTHPAEDLAFAKPILQTLTPEKCDDAFRHAWSLAGRRLFVSGNLDLAHPADDLTMAYTKSTSTIITKPAETTNEAFGYTSTGEPGKIVERKEIPDLGITQLRFANNVRVNLKHTDFEANRIRVLVQFGGGKLELPASKPGLAFVTDAVFTEGGLGKHSADDLQRLLAGKTVGAGFSTGTDFFNLSGVTSPADFRLELELLKAFLTDPGYRPESLALARRQFPEFFRRLETDVDAAASNELARFPTGDNFRFGFPTQAQADAVSLDDVKAWLAPELAKSYVEIAIVGDFDPAATETALAATFGTLPARAENRADYASALEVKFPADVLGTEHTVTVDSAIPKATALVFWPTFDMIQDIDRTRQMGVLAEVFTDRLRVQIRQQTGQIYSADVSNSSSQVYPKFGFAFAYIPSNPKDTAALADKARDIGQQLADSGVTQDEFDRAIMPMRKSIGEYRRQNPYWLGRVLAGSQAYPYQLDWARTLPTAYDKITPEQVNALAKVYLTADKAARLLILPNAPAASPPAVTPAP